MPSEDKLSRRERQIMDALYRLGSATAAEIMAEMPSPPTNAAVRRMLAILEEKGFVGHDVDGPRYVYSPTVEREQAARSALRHLRRTFFQDSPVKTFATLLDESSNELSREDLEALSRLIDEAGKAGR